MAARAAATLKNFLIDELLHTGVIVPWGSDLQNIDLSHCHRAAAHIEMKIKRV